MDHPIPVSLEAADQVQDRNRALDWFMAIAPIEFGLYRFQPGITISVGTGFMGRGAVRLWLASS